VSGMRRSNPSHSGRERRDKIGVVEWSKNGVLEWWNIGLLGSEAHYSIIPILHHSKYFSHRFVIVRTD
jgi:hypothetical protein